MNTPPLSNYRHRLAAAVSMLLTVTVAVAQETTETPTAPAETPETIVVSPPEQTPRTAVDEIYDELELSEKDRQILIKLRDDTRSIDEIGFYLIFSRVVNLPQLDKADRLLLDSPSPSNLVVRPGDYRFKPMRMLLRVHTVTELTTDTRHSKRLISPSPYWPADKPIYRIHAIAADPQTKVGLPSQPVIVYSASPPPDLPEPIPAEEGTIDFGVGKAPLYDVLAVFFKAVKQDSRGSEGEPSTTMRYPVVVAWQWDSVATVPTSDAGEYVLGGILLLGVLLGGSLFLLLRKRAKRYKKSGGMWEKYHAARDAQADEDDEDAEEEESVDPELADAARQYRQQRGLDNTDEVTP